MKYLTFLFILFLLNCGAVDAEEITELRFSEKNVYHFRFDAGKSNTVNNFFIKEIARYNFLNLVETTYEFKYEYGLTVKIISKSEIEINSRILCGKFDGDIFYNSFDLSYALIPSFYNCKLDFCDNTGKPIVNLYLEDIPTGRFFNKKLIIQDEQLINEGSYSIQVQEISFNYSDEDKYEFVKEINNINEFLACSELLSISLEKAEKINPDDTSRILKTFIKFYDLDRFLIFAKNQNFENKIELQEKESKKFKTDINTLESKLKRIHTIFYQNLDTLNYPLCHSDLVDAVHELIRIQKDYVNSAETTNYLFETVFLGLVSFNGGWNSFEVLSGEIADIFSTYGHTNDIKKVRDNFALILFEQYLENSDKLIENENFNEALLLLENAGKVCSEAPEIDCSLDVFQNISRAKYGIFDSYLLIADQALSAGNTELAENYVKLASEFQYENKEYIISDITVKKYYEELAWQYIVSGREYFQSSCYDLAAENYNKALEICRQENIHRFDEYILSGIEKTRKHQSGKVLNNSVNY